jgi:phosphoglycolate phosphatase
MKNIRLIIFDLDGTLVNAYPAIIRSFNYVMQNLNYPRQPDLIIRRAVGRGDENLLKPFINKKDLRKATAIYRGHHKKALITGSKLFPRARAMLRYLKDKGYKLAVASNRPTGFSLILIRHLGIKEYFDYVLCADKLKRGKPHPAIIRKIMQKFGVLEYQTLYVGDMIIDAQAGRRAKVKTIIVTTGSSTVHEIRKERPYGIINKIEKLQKFV